MADVAATPTPWAILTLVAAALAQIRVANGYRTDIGASVELEAVQNPTAVSEGITLYSSALLRPDEPGNHNAAISTRDFEFVIEAAVPLAAADGVVPAHARIHDIIADIEQAFDAGVPTTDGAIPAVFQDVVFLDRPAGLAAIVAQYTMTARYRRAA